MPTTLTATVEISSYNDRRFARPWIARIAAWPAAGSPELVWGSYLGGSQGGRLEIVCTPGDIIRYGQKDSRGGKGTSDSALVLEDASLLPISELAAADYLRADASSRTAMVARWLALRDQKAAQLAEAQQMFAQWRADNTLRDIYSRAIALEKEAKALIA